MSNNIESASCGKKLIIFLVLFSLILVNPAIAEVEGLETSINYDAMMALALKTEGQRVTVLFSPDFENNLKIYELDVDADCDTNVIEGFDFLFIDSATKIEPMPGDTFTNFSLTSIFSNPDLATNVCTIITVRETSSRTIGLHAAINLQNGNYGIESIDGEFLLENQNNCISNNLGDLSIILTEQYSDEFLAQGDKVVGGFSIDLESFKFNYQDVNNCPIAIVKPVKSNNAQYGGKINETTLKVRDTSLNITYAFELPFNCGILNQSELYYGEITYLDETIAYDQPIYVSLTGSSFEDETNFDITDLVDNSICRIVSYKIIDQGTDSLYQLPLVNLQIPEVINFYIGKWDREVYTDRPLTENMIGAIVKGETDPATYSVGADGKLHWLKNPEVAKRVHGPDWDSKIVWFSDGIIYTYEFGDDIDF